MDGSGPNQARKGERVRWYLFASTSFEIHAPHWHGILRGEPLHLVQQLLIGQPTE